MRSWDRRIQKCPLCGDDGATCLLGPLPIWLCEDEACSCVWGFWSEPAMWLADRMQPNEGWLMLRYNGSYLGALWASLTHKGVE